MTREEYRKGIIQEDSKLEAGQNCRLALNKFFSMFPPKKQRVITLAELNTAIAPLLKGSFNVEFVDSKWRVYDLETIKEIKQYAWWQQDNPSGGEEYQLDFSDCDDFAEFCKSLWALFWKTNSLGRCSGSVYYNGETNLHAFDLVLAIDTDDKVKAYLFDSEFNTEPTLLTDDTVSINKTTWNIFKMRI